MLLVSTCWHCKRDHQRIGPVLCIACDSDPQLHAEYEAKRAAWMEAGARHAREFAAIFPEEPEPHWNDDTDDDDRFGLLNPAPNDAQDEAKKWPPKN
jgi:hypothetical protein